MNLLTRPAEMQAWKDHPGTQAFLAYLRDRQTMLAKAWAEGKALEPSHQVEAMLLGQLADLSPDMVAEHFGVEVSGE